LDDYAFFVESAARPCRQLPGQVYLAGTVDLPITIASFLVVSKETPTQLRQREHVLMTATDE
jgi:hypothetical protein